MGGPSQIREEGEATVRAAGTLACCEAPHEVLIRGGGWHEAEVTLRSCEAPTRHQGVPHVSAVGVSMLPRRRQGEGGCTKAGRSRAGDSALRRRLRMQGQVRGCHEPSDQGVDVVQAPMRGEGVHKGWTR